MHSRLVCERKDYDLPFLKFVFETQTKPTSEENIRNNCLFNNTNGKSIKAILRRHSAACGKVLISLNAGVCMLFLEKHCGLSVSQYTTSASTSLPLPSFSFYSVGFCVPALGRSSQRSTSTEADV